MGGLAVMEITALRLKAQKTGLAHARGTRHQNGSHGYVKGSDGYEKVSHDGARWAARPDLDAVHVRKPFDDLLHGRALGGVCEFTAHSSHHYGRRQASGVGLGGTVPARQHSSISVTNASGNLAFHASKVEEGKTRL